MRLQFVIKDIAYIFEMVLQGFELIFSQYKCSNPIIIHNIMILLLDRHDITEII